MVPLIVNKFLKIKRSRLVGGFGLIYDRSYWGHDNVLCLVCNPCVTQLAALRNYLPHNNGWILMYVKGTLAQVVLKERA